jgi:hypothetical protein
MSHRKDHTDPHLPYVVRRMQSTFVPHLTYTLDTTSTTGSASGSTTDSRDTDTIYIPFTSYTNTQTLPQLRGPNFRLPPSVVASLCRIRDIEASTSIQQLQPYEPKYTFWCQWLDTQESYQMVPPPLPHSYVSEIPTSHVSKFQTSHHRPTVEEVMMEVQQWYHQSQNQYPSNLRTIVIAGEGEPTLRLFDLIQLIQRIRDLPSTCSTQSMARLDIAKQIAQSPNLPIRIMTNGLLNQEQTQQLLQACCTKPLNGSDNFVPITLSVIFVSSNPQQYHDIMAPILNSLPNQSPSLTTTTAQHTMVLDFIRTVVEIMSREERSAGNENGQLSLEITAIDRPEIDQAALTRFVHALGVTAPIRWRRYFR